MADPISRATRAALAAAALALAACGVSFEPSPTAAPAGASAEALTAVTGAAAAALAGTATVSVTLAGATVFGGTPATASGSGAFDFRNLRGALTLSPPGSGAIEPVVFGPTAIYIRPPPGGPALPPGKTWIVADFAEAAGAIAASSPAFLLQAESVNPALTVSELLWGATSAAMVGQAGSGGQGTIAYDVRVDLARALGNASGTAGLPFALALQSEQAALARSQAGPAAVTVRVWLDQGGRLTRMRQAPPGAGVGTETTALSGFGGAVSAEPPAGQDVVEFTALSPAGERENANGGDSDGG